MQILFIKCGKWIIVTGLWKIIVGYSVSNYDYTNLDSSESVSICSSNGTSPGNQKHDHGSTPSLSSIEVLQENVAPDGEGECFPFLLGH